MFALERRSFIDDVLNDFDSFLVRGWVWPGEFLGGPAAATSEVEAYSNDGHLVYRFALPGVDPKDVEISAVNNELTVKAERMAPAKIKESDWHVQSFSYGKFERTLRLPKGVDPDGVEATFKRGVLEVSVPLPKAIAPKRIEVKELAEVNA